MNNQLFLIICVVIRAKIPIIVWFNALICHMHDDNKLYIIV